MSKRLEFMTEAERKTTKAFWVWSKTQADASARFMLLMDHAKKSLDESPTLPRALFDVPQSFDLIDEAKQNKELHASMDFMRLLLKNHRSYVIEPRVATPPYGGGKLISPLEHAAALNTPYPELGEWLTKRLNQHEIGLHKTGYEFQYLTPKHKPRPL